MIYKNILTTLTFAFTLTLIACTGSGGGGGSTPSGSNEPTVIRANTYNAQGDVTGYKLTTLNSANNPIRETYYNNAGQSLSSIEYTYDGPRLTGRIHRNADGEITTRTRISYAGTTRNSTRRAPDGTLLSYTITTTNNDGQTTREDTYAPNGNLREYTIYIYDSDGLRIEQRRYAGGDLELMTYTRYRYHPDDTLRSEHTYDAEGDLVGYTTYTYGRGAALSTPSDSDGDGIADARDNCSTIANANQANTIGGPNDEGDACDDTDNDGVYDASDNCPTTPNSDQTDRDRDGTGDACDEGETRPSTNITFNEISRLAQLLSVAGKPGHVRLTAHIEITPEILRTSTGSAEWTPLPHYGVLDGNGYTIRGLNHYALFSTIAVGARVTNLGILGGILANENSGTISHSYATGDSIGRGSRGGLVRVNSGIIRDSYALGNSATTDTTSTQDVAGGLVGYNTGTISHSYATGSATHGGLTGNNRGTAINSYAVHPTTNTLGEQRTITQLQCPTAPGARACFAATVVIPRTYIGWNSTVWDFGHDTELPILRGFAPCPRTAPNCRRYRAAGDDDNDDIANLIDNCPIVPNPHQYNNDSDLLGDACDPDDDGDGIEDARDNCPTIANRDQQNTVTPDDTEGDACDDSDNDGIHDITDNCPTIANRDQQNTVTSGDAEGDACDDPDNDGIYDITDNCPTIANRDQNNTVTPGDAKGDACDDPDNDGIYDITDNCPTIANAEQTNLDGDAAGDACDPLISITNATTLQAITNGNYQITTNLSIPGSWTPIRNFRGTLDGNNHVIRGLDAPLFDTINSTATVTNIGILSSTLARANYGNVSYTYTTGHRMKSSVALISVGGGFCSFGGRCFHDIILVAGGLVDTNFGRISDSYATGDIRPLLRPPVQINVTSPLVGEGFSDIMTHYAREVSLSGGLVGENIGNINRSYATGNVSCGYGSTCGGLIGDNDYIITSSYATGNSDGGSQSGGLVGWNSGTTTNSYATGNSRGDYRSGGLVGYNWDGATITNSYATGNSHSDDFRRTDDSFINILASGGLVGTNAVDGIITNSYAIGNSSTNSSDHRSILANGGLVGQQQGRNAPGDYATITNSYRVQTGIDHDLGTAITLPNLRAAISFSGWSTSIWDFGTTSQLPRHTSNTGIPLCPGTTSYGITTCRW